MNVLITKQNEPFFKELLPKVVFIESTVNTSFFKISEKKFVKLRDEIRAKGHNPYAVMAW
ncbi:MAG: hypothetical protein V4580_17380 [Bacteroidota bacterium]